MRSMVDADDDDVETVKAVSQCFHSTGVSFVTLYCGYQHFIDIEHAIHGRRPLNADAALTSYCHLLPTDCLIDVTGQYDWSACRGQRHCVHLLRHFNDLDHDRHCADHQRLSYLQVSRHYWLTEPCSAKTCAIVVLQ